MEELISVVIPVFKVENYLSECVDSILSQTYKNIEVILVDDGSPDKCGEICDSYKQKDKRVYVIHKDNGGLSDARNVGISVAKGRYITFVDSDDVLDKYFIQKSVEVIHDTDADIVVMPYMKYKDGNNPIFIYDKSDNIQIINSEEALKEMLIQNMNVPVSAHSKLYKKKLFDEIEYPKGKYFEDLATTYKLFAKSKKIACSQIPRYGYRLRSTGIIREKFSVQKMDMIEVADMLYNDIIKSYPNLKIYVASRVLSGYFTVFLQINENEFLAEQEILWNKICQYRKIVLKSHEVRFKTKSAAILSFFGKKCVRAVFKIIK